MERDDGDLSPTAILIDWLRDKPELIDAVNSVGGFEHLRTHVKASCEVAESDDIAARLLDSALAVVRWGEVQRFLDEPYGMTRSVAA